MSDKEMDTTHSSQKDFEKHQIPKTEEPVETEANILPQVEQEPQQDIEKVPSKSPSAFAVDPSQFPDGGIKAWSVVLGGFCCL
jgi:hypothetical protein